MTPRERVQAALRHQQPDQIPVDFGSHRSSGIMAIAYHRLRDYLGLPKRPAKVYDFIQQLAFIEDDVLERFPSDVIDLSRPYCQDDSGWKEWVLPNGEACLIPKYVDVRKEDGDWWLYNDYGRKCGVMRAGSLYFDQVLWPYQDGIPEGAPDYREQAPAQMWAAVPTPPKGAGLEEMVARAKRLRDSTDRAINYIFGGNLYEPSTFLCTIPNAMMWMLLEPENYAALLDKMLADHLAAIETRVKALAPYLDVILFGDDFGMSTGTQFSTECYKEFFQPRERAMWKRVKEIAPHLKIQLHSCGGIAPFIPLLAEAGLDAFNPVQTNCTGMDPVQLKKSVGDKIVFWGGGCDTAWMLPRGTPAQIREHVLERCRIFSPGGGFIFQQIHNIMAGVPPENIEAMFDAVREFNAG